MKTWYRAVCDKCGEAVHVMVNGPVQSNAYLGDQDSEIRAWLSKHFECELRLIWRDDHLDAMFDEGWRRAPGELGMLRKP